MLNTKKSRRVRDLCEMLEGTEGTCQDRSDLHIARFCHCLGYKVFKQGLPRKSLLKCVRKS
jgi:hypothetical protein